MLLANSYILPNQTIRLTTEEVRKVLDNFEYFMNNYQQVVNKGRETVPFKLNPFQREFCATLLPMIHPDTRLERRHTIVVDKPRQVGASTIVVAFINYVCTYVKGMNHLNILHTFPVGDTISKFYNQKVQPLITGVHPDLYPTIDKEIVGKTSIVTHYRDLKGIARNNDYELISANASSIRSTTAHVWIADEVGFYAHPEELEAAVSPALPDYGFSLVVYLSTFNERKSDYFINKMKAARDNPETHTLLFAPWFMVYPEQTSGIDWKMLVLTPYDKDVIIPAMQRAGVAEVRWGDCIDWYHRKSPSFARMKQEYPTTVEEVLRFSEEESYFPQELIETQQENLMDGTRFKVVKDPITSKYEAIPTDVSPLKVFRLPRKGHQYAITIDPILAVDESSDFFAASVFDRANNEQVAVIHGRDMALDAWVEYTIGVARLYNRAMLCPEWNIAQAFVLLANASGYYNWFYINSQTRAKKEPGLRTTVGTKVPMLDRLQLLLKNKRIIIHDKNTYDELTTFIRKVNANSGKVTCEAKKGKHDDLVTCLWLYAGMLDEASIQGRASGGWTVL